MSYTLVLEWMPGDLYMSAVTARCTAPTSSYSVVWLPPNKVYQITLYCGSTSLVSFLVGAFRGKAWSYMKRALLFIFMTVCVLGMSACSSKDAMPETSDSASNPVQNTDISNLNGGKIWSEQDIVSMFSLVQETDWEYIDCVLIPDHASDRVGAVLFRNDKEQTSNVAFFDADGYFQQYGTYARMSDEPDFQYLGGGAVTFKLETEDGIIYNYTITISIDDSNVNFKAEDDLPK